jgi:hypothetical protein
VNSVTNVSIAAPFVEQLNVSMAGCDVVVVASELGGVVEVVDGAADVVGVIAVVGAAVVDSSSVPHAASITANTATSADPGPLADEREDRRPELGQPMPLTYPGASISQALTRARPSAIVRRRIWVELGHPARRRTGEPVPVSSGELAEAFGDRVDGRLAGGDVDHEVVDVVVAGP